MTKSTVATDVHQSLDVHLHLASHGAFDAHTLDDGANRAHFIVVQSLDFLIVRDAYLIEDIPGSGTTNTVDVGQCDYGVLRSR
jgi:hypothetical protein